MNKNKSHTISFFSHRGGRGKSTFACNLALQISERGYKTLLIDMDIHAPQLQYIFDVEVETYINEVFESRIHGLKQKERLRLDDAITNTSIQNLDLVCASPKPDLNDTMILISEQHSRELFLFLQNSIKRLVNKYPVIIFDCPSQLNYYMISAISLSKWKIGVLTPDKSNIEGTRYLLEVINPLIPGTVIDLFFTFISLRTHLECPESYHTWSNAFEEFDIRTFKFFHYSDDINHRRIHELGYFFKDSDPEKKIVETYLDEVL